MGYLITSPIHFLNPKANHGRLLWHVKINNFFKKVHVSFGEKLDLDSIFFLKFTVICLNQFCNLENIVLAVKIVHFLNLVLKEIIEKIGGWIK